MRILPKPTNGSRDASDWFNPILVKELRQGTRSRTFVWSFIAVQTALLLLIVIALDSAASAHTVYNQDVFTGLFWTLIAIPLLLLLPVVGFGGIKKELDAKTLELIFLTRMTTLRIVAGKWVALTVQGLLFVSAILPYMILRYFLGGVDLVDELLILLVLLLASLCLTATAVGLSSITSKFFRSAIILFVVLFVFQGLSVTTSVFFGAAGRIFSVTSGTDASVWLFPLFAVPLFIFLMLEFGAARIAPPAENHAFRKRGAGLALLAGCVGLHFGFDKLWPPLVLVAIPLFFLCLEAVNEPLRPYGIIVRARRAQGKSFPIWVRLFLAPGWPSGTIFTALVAGVYLSLLATDSGMAPEALLVALSLSAGLFLPVAVIRITSPHTERSLVRFLLFQVLMICAGVSALVITETTLFNVSTFYQYIPVPVLILLASGELDGSIQSATVAMSFVNGISVLVLLALGARTISKTVVDARPEAETALPATQET